MSLIAMKHSSVTVTVTGPLQIANVFDNCFTSIAEKTKVDIRFSNKSFQDSLLHPNEEWLFIALADAHEGKLIISSLNSDKSISPK